MFGEDMQSDQLPDDVPANRTVDFCSSMTLFALRKNFTFHTVTATIATTPAHLLLALVVFEFLSSFGSLHVLR